MNARKQQQQLQRALCFVKWKKMTTGEGKKKKKTGKKHSQFNLQWKATVEEVISLGNMHGRPFRCTPIRFSWSAVIFKSDTG